MRIAILGNAGSGKSTLAAKLAQTYDLPLFEMDKLMWGKDWAMTPESTFNAKHDQIIGGDHWVIDGLGHKSSFAPRIARATHVIFCDFPLWQNYWLVSERQVKWHMGQLELKPGNQPLPPDARELFETIWRVDKNWMPEIRELVRQAKPTTRIEILESFEALKDFRFSRSP